MIGKITSIGPIKECWVPRKHLCTVDNDTDGITLIRIHVVVHIISSYVVSYCIIRVNPLRLVYNLFTIILGFVDTLRVDSVSLRP
jgi:hypothetical protein